MSGSPGPSEIVRGLFLGNRQDAMDLDGLRLRNIKFVLNVAAQLDNFHEKEEGMRYLKISVKDSEKVDLTKYYEKVRYSSLSFLLFLLLFFFVKTHSIVLFFGTVLFPNPFLPDYRVY